MSERKDDQTRLDISFPDRSAETQPPGPGTKRTRSPKTQDSGPHPSKDKPTLTRQEQLDLLADDFVARIRAGENPSIAEYQKLYPDLASEIEDVLGSVAMIEDLKSHQDTIGTRRKKAFDSAKFERIGDYKIVRELGRGGMGIVFEAIHESLGRKVAIKLLPAKVFDDDNALLRFRKEASAASRLHHSNIVNVFGVGEHEGYHYYVMELVNGKTLADWIRLLHQQQKSFDAASDQSSNLQPDKKITAAAIDQLVDRTTRYRWSAEQISRIADALEYSHSNQILHRDIKPANILIDQEQKPWITDFGLVKELTNQSMTGTGDIFGTPQYLAPESLEGKYDQRSEVYCLGLTLYELLALQPAYSDTSPTQLFKRIATSNPRSLRQLEPQIPRDLETIVQRAIDRDPDRRYQSAGELRDDLKRFCSDLPIKARRILPVERAYRWAKRNPLTASLTALSAVLLIAVACVSSYAYFSTNNALDELAKKHSALQEEKKKTEDAKKLAEKNEDLMREEFVRAEANVELSIEAFDRLFVRIMTKGVGRDVKANLELETFSELSTLESSVTKDDARILQSAIEFYELFTERNQDNEKLRLEIAKAYRRIANTYHFLGSFSSAQRGYRKAIESYLQIVKDKPDDIASVVNLAETHNELGLAYRKQGKLVMGMKEHENAKRILQRKSYSDSQACQFALGNTLIQLCSFSSGLNMTGGRNWRLDRVADVKKNARQALGEFLRLVPKRTALLRQAEGISRELLDKDPDNPDYRLQRARLFQAKATIFGVDGETKIEVTQLRESVSELEKLVKDFPDNPNYLFALAHTYTVRLRNVSPEIQLEMYNKADRICKELVEDYPSVVEYLDLSASVSTKLGSLLGRKKKFDEAIKSLEDAKKSFQSLTRKTPSVVSYYFQYAFATEQAAILHFKNGDREQSRRQWQELLWFVQRTPIFNRNRQRKMEMLEKGREELRKLRSR